MNEYNINKIKEYFVGLGYNEPLFRVDVLFNNDLSNYFRVDFIVYKLNQPYIVIESKNSKRFSNFNIEDLKYDPSVRQVQTYAMNVGANYYVVTNGIEFLWFKNGTDGRPVKIDAVIFGDINTEGPMKIEISEALNTCKKILNSDDKKSDSMYKLILILLARFAAKDTVKCDEIYNKINFILESKYNIDIDITSRIDDKSLKNCWFILSECRPETIDTNEIISVLNLLVQKSKKEYLFRVNEKISNFLVKLINLTDTQVLLDPSANLGEIFSSIALKNYKNQIYLYCESPQQYAFLTLINTIMYDNTHNIMLVSIKELVLSTSIKFNAIKPDIIISVFPFGKLPKDMLKLTYGTQLDVNNIEDYMLIVSLETLKENGRLVAIVPDSMLFEGGRRKTLRKYIIENYNLRSIISLPPGAISNNNVKVSIIVVDKEKTHSSSVFFGIVDNENFSKKNWFVDDNNNAVSLLKAYYDYMNNNNIESSNIWSCFAVDSDTKNLRAETFLSATNSNIMTKYPLYPIKDICLSIKRGTLIKNVVNGTIPFLVPASIRANKIDETKMLFTSYENIKKSTVYVQKGTVVMNNSSSNLGDTSVIESDKQIAINQHIVALVPNTELIMAQYLAIALNNKYVNSTILIASTGVSIPSITLESLKEICIPVPNLYTQKIIVDSVYKIQEQLTILEETKKSLESKLDLIINDLGFEEVY